MLKKPEQVQAIEDLTEEDKEDVLLKETENFVDENLANVEKLNNIDIGQFVLVGNCFGKQSNHSAGQTASIVDDDGVLINFMVRLNKSFYWLRPEQEFAEDRCNIYKILNTPELGHMEHFIFSINDMEGIIKCCRE